MSLPQQPPSLWNDITSGLGEVGSAIANTPATVLPNSPTWGQDFSQLKDYISSNVNAFKKNPTAYLKNSQQQLKQHPEELMPMVIGSLGGDMTSVPPDLGAGTHLIQDEKGNFVPNPDYQAPQYAQDTTSADATTSEPGSPESQPQAPESTEPITKPPVTRTYPYDPNAPLSSNDQLTNAKRNIQLGQDIKTPNEAAQVNSTLNGYDINGSATDQLQQVNDKIGDLQKQAQDVVTREGGYTPKSSLVSQITKDVSYGNTNIPPLQIEGSVNQYIDKVYQQAMGGNVTGDITGVTPDQIPDPVLQKMKTIMNQDSMSTWNQPDPSKWTFAQQISRYARNALDNMLDTSHPNASALNNDMSDLYKAQESLTKGANAESSAAMKAAGQPQPNFIQKAWSNPWIRYPALAAGIGEGTNIVAGIGKIASSAGGAAAGLAQNLIGDLASHDQSKEAGNPNTLLSKPPHLAGSIPQDDKGHYQLPPNPGVKPFTPGTPAYTQAQNALPGNAREFMVNAPQYISSANAVQDDVKNGMPLNIMSSFKSSRDVQAYLSNPKSPYAQQLADVGQLNAEFRAAYTQINGTPPDDTQVLSPGDSAQQFQEKYSEMLAFLYNNYSQFQIPYLQTTEAPVSTNVQNVGNTSVQTTLPYNPPALGGNSTSAPIDSAPTMMQ